MKKTKDTLRPGGSHDEARQRATLALTSLSVAVDRELDQASADLVQCLIGVGLEKLGIILPSSTSKLVH